MSLCPGGRVAGSDPGLVTLLTAGDGVISDQCPWSLVQCCLDTLHQPCTGGERSPCYHPPVSRVPRAHRSYLVTLISRVRCWSYSLLSDAIQS